ncbi:nuclear transport factor 2 family protein [Streptosporangium sp. NPDC048047]|uniref:YybH family protein n=1 Tax=Streptosporangium sp. NPDC048047 TaxID=3155748 RepID=UPI0034171D5D
MTITATPGDRASLLDHDRRFFDALVAADTAELGDLLAGDFVIVAVNDGAVATAADLLGAMSSGDLRFPAVRSFPEEAVVRRVGDVGIVVGRTEMSFTGDDGTAFTAGSRYTHVFAADPAGGWRLVSAQGTEIKPAP